MLSTEGTALGTNIPDLIDLDSILLFTSEVLPCDLPAAVPIIHGHISLVS